MGILNHKLMRADGTMQTVAEIVAEMQANGTRQILIDRWLQGLELGLRVHRVPPYAVRQALRDATLAVGRGKR